MLHITLAESCFNVPSTFPIVDLDSLSDFLESTCSSCTCHYRYSCWPACLLQPSGVQASRSLTEERALIDKAARRVDLKSCSVLYSPLYYDYYALFFSFYQIMRFMRTGRRSKSFLYSLLYSINALKLQLQHLPYIA